jgi:hypothetical protein
MSQLDHDQSGRPRMWTAEEQLRRQRKALRDGILACVLILLGWIILLTLVAPRLKGQELGLRGDLRPSVASKVLPEVPEPHIVAPPASVRPAIGVERSRFWDRPNRVAALTMVSLAAADMAQTCRFLARGRHEDYLTQSCAGNVALTSAFEVGALAGAWALHHSGHHRLERVPMVFMAGQSARAIIYSHSKGGW